MADPYGFWALKDPIANQATALGTWIAGDRVYSFGTYTISYGFDPPVSGGLDDWSTANYTEHTSPPTPPVGGIYGAMGMFIPGAVFPIPGIQFLSNYSNPEAFFYTLAEDLWTDGPAFPSPPDPEVQHPRCGWAVGASASGVALVGGFYETRDADTNEVIEAGASDQVWTCPPGGDWAQTGALPYGRGGWSRPSRGVYFDQASGRGFGFGGFTVVPLGEGTFDYGLYGYLWHYDLFEIDGDHLSTAPPEFEDRLSSEATVYYNPDTDDVWLYPSLGAGAVVYNVGEDAWRLEDGGQFPLYDHSWYGGGSSTQAASLPSLVNRQQLDNPAGLEWWTAWPGVLGSPSGPGFFGSWRVGEGGSEPVAGGDADFAEFAAGTPAHIIIGPDGEAEYPMISDWETREQANGGWMSERGRIAGRLVRDNPGVFVQDAEWLTVIKETGDPAFWSLVKELAPNEGVVDMAGEGPGMLAMQGFPRMLFRRDGIEGWTAGNDSLSDLRPSTAPKTGAVATVGSGLTGSGNYKYAMTFADVSGEGVLGPATSISLVAGGPYSVEVNRIPLGPKGTITRRLYRKDPAALTFKLLAAFADNTTDTYVDSTPDGTLGADAPTSQAAEEISLEPHDNKLVAVVERDGAVLADQYGDWRFAAPTADLFAVRATVFTQRPLPFWEEAVLVGPWPRGPYLEQAVIALDNDGEAIDLYTEFEDEGDTVFLRLRPTEDIEETFRVRVEIDTISVYGLAHDDEYSDSDMIRESASRSGVRTIEVEESAMSAMPQDFARGVLADVNDVAAMHRGWRWRYYRNHSVTDCDYGPFSKRRWMLIPGECVRRLLPLPRFNQVTIPWKFRDDIVIEQVTATASPNPLDGLRPSPPVDLAYAPANGELAGELAQTLADFYASLRLAGTVEMAQVYDEEGFRTHAHFVQAGDQLFDPVSGLWLNVDQTSRSQVTLTATMAPGVPGLDRYNARQAARG